eukprot:6923773-Prorocentrum_lima.AAC.1
MVADALKGFPKQTVTGVDGWNPRAWSHLSPPMLERLAAILTACEKKPHVPLQLLTPVSYTHLTLPTICSV